jgi:hypothetical protein
MTKIKRLTKKDKEQIVKDMKCSGWSGCMCDECLLLLAETVLKYQLKENNG